MKEANALFEHCETVYAEMARQAFQMKIPVERTHTPTCLVTTQGKEYICTCNIGEDTDGTVEYETVLVYEGYLTKLFIDLGLSVPYYSSVMRELKRMDCVRQQKRGGGSSKSQWLIVQPPDRVLYEHLPELTSAMGGKHVQARFEQMIKGLQDQLNTIEKQLTNLQREDARMDKELKEVLDSIKKLPTNYDFSPDEFDSELEDRGMVNDS